MQANQISIGKKKFQSVLTFTISRSTCFKSIACIDKHLADIGRAGSPPGEAALCDIFINTFKKKKKICVHTWGLLSESQPDAKATKGHNKGAVIDVWKAQHPI